MSMERGASVLTAQNIDLSIGDRQLFKDLSISVHEKDRLGLVGRNGVGKSTLLRVLAGNEEVADGEIAWRNQCRFAFLSQEFELDMEKTVKENVYLGASYQFDLIQQYESLAYNDPRIEKVEAEMTRVHAWGVDNLYAVLREHLGLVGDDRICKDLSGGEKRRVALAQTLIGRPDFLILDEPTNHLDIPTIQWLEDYLRSFQGAIILITHDRYFLDRISTGIIELDRAQLFMYEGNYSQFLMQKAEREMHLEVVEGKRKQLLKKELAWLRKGVKARGTKSKKRINAYHEEEKKEAFKKDDDVDLIIPRARVLGNRVLEATDISKSLGGKHLFSDLSVEFEDGKNVGIVGQNGLGKSTLLKILIEQLQPDSGTVKVGDRTEFNYFDQLKSNLNEESTILDEVAEKQDFVDIGGERVTVRGYLKRFLFTDERINTPIKYLSGGERSRLILAKQLKYGGNFLILDEPTNDLDLQTLRVLEDGLDAFEGCALIVSHDRYFLNRTCDAIIAFEGNGEVIYQEGDYDYYLEKKEERDQERERAALVVAEEPKKQAGRGERKKTKLSYREQQEFDGMEEKIFGLEAEVEEIEATFMDPAFYSSPAHEQKELKDKLDTLKSECETLYARWEELEELKADLEG